MKINVYGKDLEAQLPKSLATCLELSLVWGNVSDDHAQLCRLCAAVIGICTDHLAILPHYNPQRDRILNYGHKVLDRLLEKNSDVSLMFSDGTKLLTAITQKVPKQKEVNETKDFLASAEEDG